MHHHHSDSAGCLALIHYCALYCVCVLTLQGADLCHLFCTEEAAIPIKSYSPELIVHPLLRSDSSLKTLAQTERKSAIAHAADRICDVFPRLDVLVIGPGLGRDAAVQEVTRELIQRARAAQLPLILDGDALFLTSLHPEIVRDNKHAILTPNAVGSHMNVDGWVRYQFD